MRNDKTFKCDTIKVAKEPKAPKGAKGAKGMGAGGAGQEFTYTYYYSESRLYSEETGATSYEEIINIMTRNGASKSIVVKSNNSTDFNEDIDLALSSDLPEDLTEELQRDGNGGAEYLIMKKNGVLVGVQSFFVGKEGGDDENVWTLTVQKPDMTSDAPSYASGEMMAKMKQLISTAVLCEGRIVKKDRIEYI
jgi:hypothetical protein